MDGNGWLPQIGTSSDCNDPLTYGATYHLAWEMQAQPQGAGNAVQENLKCNTGDKYYNVCARHYTPGGIGGTPISAMRISAGDHINAAVALSKGQCASNPYPANNGLAQFDTPIHVSNMALLTDSPASSWSNYEWVMQRIADPVTGEIHQLAQNSDPAGSAQQGMSFTVTWLSRY
jgi:hypothetical protein